MKIRDYEIVDRLMEAYRNDCDMAVYWNLDEKKIINRFEDICIVLTYKPRMIRLGVFEKETFNELKLTEFLEPDELEKYHKFMKEKDEEYDPTCELVKNIENIENFLDELKEENEEVVWFYDRLHDFFVRNNLNKKIFNYDIDIVDDALLEKVWNDLTILCDICIYSTKETAQQMTDNYFNTWHSQRVIYISEEKKVLVFDEPEPDLEYYDMCYGSDNWRELTYVGDSLISDFPFDIFIHEDEQEDFFDFCANIDRQANLNDVWEFLGDELYKQRLYDYMFDALGGSKSENGFYIPPKTEDGDELEN